MDRDDALGLLSQAVSDDSQQLARYAWGVFRNHGAPLPDRSALEEIVGEAVLTATQIIRSSDGRIPTSGSGLRIWLRKIVSLKSLEYMRKLSKESETRKSLDSHMGELAVAEWTDLLEKEELNSVVRAAIGNLKEREQQVLSMSFLRGATSQRIGKELGLSANAVRKIKMRSLNKLRKRLERLGA